MAINQWNKIEEEKLKQTLGKGIVDRIEDRNPYKLQKRRKECNKIGLRSWTKELEEND